MDRNRLNYFSSRIGLTNLGFDENPGKSSLENGHRILNNFATKNIAIFMKDIRQPIGLLLKQANYAITNHTNKKLKSVGFDRFRWQALNTIKEFPQQTVN